MVQFDATLLIQALNFLVLLAILNKIFFQPILKIQQERNESLDASRHTTESKLKELTALQAEYDEKLTSARQEAFDLVSREVEAANKDRAAQLAEVNAEIDAKLNETKAQILEQETALRSALDKDVSATSALILSRLTEQPPSKEEVTAS